MDGGIRSGQDVLKARALGARGTLIGRSFLYGLGAFGEAGVTRALQIIHKELDLTALPDGTPTSGEPFSPAAPDFGVAVVELDSGTVVRLTANFYVGHHSKQSGIELHGDTGSIFLSSWQEFDAAVELARWGGSYEPVPVANPFRGTDWGRALGELSDAIVTGRPHRATGAQAAHIVEILDAIEVSAREGRAVDVTSSFQPPALLPAPPV